LEFTGSEQENLHEISDISRMIVETNKHCLCNDVFTFKFNIIFLPCTSWL